MPAPRQSAKRKKKPTSNLPPEAHCAAPKRMRSTSPSTYRDFFYSIPNSKLLTILIIITICLIAIMFFVFRRATASAGLNDSSNNMVSTFLSLIGLPVGVILAFIVANTWSGFSDAQMKETEEATELLVLYNLVDAYPDNQGATIQESIIEYTTYIIEEEFPRMELGITSPEGLQLLLTVGDNIYDLNPITPKESSLYSEAIGVFQSILALRIVRMGYVTSGIAPELWWILILGVVIIIFMTFFIYSKHCFLQFTIIAMVGAALTSLLFLIVALDFPYKGDFGLDSLPFQITLANMTD